MSAVDTIQDVSTSDSPYVGLTFYTQQDAAMFFGRESEQTVLISNLRASRLTLLYAESGAGKSSLLCAGVASRLAELAQRSFGQRGTARNIPVVFSSWRDDATAGLIGEIQEAITPFLRAVRPRAPAPDRLDAAIEAACAATDATLLVILDQFEEYFLYRSRESHDRPFADELATCINRSDLRVHFLISIREDAYSGLGDLFKRRIGNVYGNYFHLEHLTREAAREAIEKPVASFNELHPRAPVEIGPGLVDAVLDQLRPDQFTSDQGGVGRLADGSGSRPARDEVAAPYLQLVMKRLWDAELEKRSRKLRLETLEELGGAQTIVRTHVDRVLGNLPDEDREAAVDILHHLVTPSGTKIALAASDLAEYTSRSTDETDALLERLAGSDIRILRPVPPRPGGTGGARFEISHDLLAPVILDWGRRRRAVRLEHEKEAAEQRAQAEKQRAQAEKRSKLRFRTATIALAIALSAVVLLAVIAVQARQSAVNQSDVAQSQDMAAEAMNLLPTDGPLAVLLSLQAYERAHTAQAESALIQAAQQPLDDLLVPGSTVRSVAFSPDGRTLATGEASGHVGLWDLATEHKTATLTEGSFIYGVAFSPDGRILAVGDDSGRIGLWDMATRQKIATLPEGNTVDSLAFSPDGRTLAVGDYGGYVGLWDVATRQKIATLSEGSAVWSVAFSPDGRILAVGDHSGRIGLWDMATKHKTATLAEGSLPVYGVAFSPDGRTLAVGDHSGRIGLWDMATRHKTATLAEGSPAGVVAFSPDGRTLASPDADGRVGLWDVATRQKIASLAEGSPVYGVAFSPDGRTLAVGDGAGYVGLWDTLTAQMPSNLAEGSPAYSVAFSPDGRILAVGDYGGYVGLWDVATGQKIAALPEGSPVNSVAFSPDGRTLAVGDYGDYGGYVGLWDVVTGQKIAALPEGSPVNSVAFSPDGRTLAVGDHGGHVGLWDVATGQKIAALPEGITVDSVAFSPDGRVLAVGDYGGYVGLWDMATRQKTTALPEGSAVWSVAFSPDGRTLAAGDGSGYVGLWDMASGQKSATLTEPSPIASVAFRPPDGRILVTGDALGDVGIWNAANGQRFANLAEGGAVASLAFSSHGPLLAIGGLNGNIVLLRQDLASLNQGFTQLICSKVRGNMTQAQWEAYAPGQPYQKTCS